MRPTGTEPGDFVEFDLDLIEADRRQRLRTALEQARPHLEAELAIELTVDNVGNDLVLSDQDGPRFTASIGPDGRLMVTDQRSSRLL
jgi:hypothetical protein